MQTEDIIEVAPGIHYQWLENYQIITFKMANNDKKAIDAYINANMDILNSWPKDRPYLTLQEGVEGFLMTPYLRQRSTEVIQIMNEHGLEGRIAAVTPSTLVAYVLQFLMRGTFHVHLNKVTTHLFTNREDAIAWLKEAL
ncbi:MAG: hypothetical protein H7Y09_08905 [Chitinophagaceae bacterium]|nr:hypothetical protein [Anaerolineae bacterium]